MHLISGVPTGGKKRRSVGGKHTLAEGEATGHAHTVEACPEVTFHEDGDGVLYLGVEQPTTITHQEHGPITVEPGTYRIGRVREVDPFTDEVREVQD